MGRRLAGNDRFRGVEQSVDGLVGEAPTDVQDDAGDDDGGEGVGVLEPGKGEALAGKDK